MNKSITEILGDAENATIIARGPNGEEYVSLEDYVNLTTADTINGRDAMRRPEMNPDNTPAGSMYHYLAVNVEQLFLNRYAVREDDGEDKVFVVTDWWTISEQESGRLPRKRIPCYVIKRAGKELKYDKTVTISDDEFLSDFTKSLDREAMAQILPLISRKDRTISEDKLPI